MRENGISVVIPLFNKAPHIRRAIDSVLGQTFRDFEVVVVDDGSTDGGPERVGGGDGRIRLVRQRRAGAAAARNAGIRAARGRLIAFLDADDSYNPGFLGEILRLAARYPAAGAYGTSLEVVREDGTRRLWRSSALRRARAEDVLIGDYFGAVLDGPVISASSSAVPARVFERVGLFPEGVELGEDLDMWMRIGARFPIALSGYVGAVYHREAANRTDNGRIRGVEYELVRTGERLLSSSGLDGAQRAHLRDYVARYQITTAYHLILLGQRDRARRMLRGCRTRRFLPHKSWWLLWTLLPTSVAVLAERAARRVLVAPAGRAA
jgi:glycosyltransferase involved in cell wall biosynthesis